MRNSAPKERSRACGIAHGQSWVEAASLYPFPSSARPAAQSAPSRSVAEALERRRLKVWNVSDLRAAGRRERGVPLAREGVRAFLPGLRSCEKINALTQRLRGAKTHLQEPSCLLGDLGDFAPLREIFFCFPTIFSHVLGPGLSRRRGIAPLGLRSPHFRAARFSQRTYRLGTLTREFY